MTEESGTRRLRCVCGEMHEVISEFQGVPVVICQAAPPRGLFLFDQSYVKFSCEDVDA